MNTHRQILMTMTAAVMIAAVGIFAGCKKDEEKVKATGVTVCPTAVMLYVDGTATLSATVMPSNADDLSVTWTSDKTDVATVENGVVTAHAIGEAVITCTTTDGGFTAKTTVIVNPAKDDGDYATLVLGFYFGDMMMGSSPIETNNPITVKYHDLNKIKLSVDEAFMGGAVPMKVDCEAELTQTDDGFYAVGETTAEVYGNICPVKVETTFDDAGNMDMTIYVSEVPKMGNLVLNFTGTVTTTACID